MVKRNVERLHVLARVGSGSLVLVLVLVLIVALSRFPAEVKLSLIQRTFQIAVPPTLTPGETVTVLWGRVVGDGLLLVPYENQSGYPYEKIQLVVPGGTRTVLYTLAPRTANDGGEALLIPPDVPTGTRAFFRFTAVDSQGRLLTGVRTDSVAVPILAASSPPPLSPPLPLSQPATRPFPVPGPSESDLLFDDGSAGGGSGFSGPGDFFDY